MELTFPEGKQTINKMSTYTVNAKKKRKKEGGQEVWGLEAGYNLQFWIIGPGRLKTNVPEAKTQRKQGRSRWHAVNECLWRKPSGKRKLPDQKPWKVPCGCCGGWRK